MKLDLFDSYNIRVRLSSSIIIFAPLALTVFLCFDELFTFISSSVFGCNSFGIYQLPSNFSKTYLSEESYFQKLCCRISPTSR